MPQLPTVGGDNGNWGQILNDFLAVELVAGDPDASKNGKLKKESIILGAQQKSEKGQPNGYAALDSNGKVVTAQLATAAGGVLAGTYPNPTFAVDMATQAELNAVAAAAGVVTNPYSGKKWAALGTSITYGGNYTAPLATRLNATLVNLGVSGASLTYEGTGDGTITALLAGVPADASLITVESGINDFWRGLALGSIADTDPNVSYYGALYNACAYLLTNRPTADIAFFTPYGNLTYAPFPGNWNTPNAAGDNLRDFWRAIHEVCSMFSIPVIKIGEESGITGPTAGLYLPDGLHPNATGGQRIADYAAPRLIAAHVGAS